MSSKGRDVLKLSAVIAIAFGVGLTAASAFDLPRSSVAQPAIAGAPPRALGARTLDGLPSFSEVVNRVNPSVVYIRTDHMERGGMGGPDLRGLPPEFGQLFRQPNQQPRRVQGAGSGFIVSQDGYILTNNHVVAGADHVKVQLIDNRVFDARVIGRDPDTDVAVIKIDATGLPAIAFGNADDIRIGDWVLAVGNPLGFTFTVTAGIVSAKGRSLAGLVDPGARYSIQDFIQTDAAINPGNSGGPLLDLNGQVVGINSAIASSTGLYAGYGFAIPINLARRVMDELITRGRVERAILGIGIDDVSPEDAEYVGLSAISGVLVQGFSSDDSPAARAGLRAGDVIVAVNDSAVTHRAQLQQMVRFKRAGETVRVTVVRREEGRAGVRRTVNVRLTTAPVEAVVASAPGRDIESAKPSRLEGKLGLAIQALTPEIIRRAGLTDDQRGVLVADVESGGPAEGRIANPASANPDVILAVDEQRVRTPEEFERALRNVRPGAVVQLTVLNLTRDSDPRIVRIRARR